MFDFAIQGWFAFLMGAVGIISLLAALYAIFWNVEKKQFSYFILDVRDLGIEERDYRVKSGKRESIKRPIIASLIIIANGGNRPIDKSDIVKSVSFIGNLEQKGGRFIYAGLYKSNSDGNDIRIDIDGDDQATIGFEFLRQGEYICALVVHTYLDCCVSVRAMTKHRKNVARAKVLILTQIIDQLLFVLFQLLSSAMILVSLILIYAGAGLYLHGISQLLAALVIIMPLGYAVIVLCVRTIGLASRNINKFIIMTFLKYLYKINIHISSEACSKEILQRYKNMGKITQPVLFNKN